MDDRHFRQLLDYLGLSWEGYRKVRKGVKKRIVRHMHTLGCNNMATYLMRLGTDVEARQQSDLLMTVSISRFFRDRKLWEILKSNILPKMIDEAQGQINVWIAGCASGEEVYSLRIIWEELKRLPRRPPPMTLLATDMNPLYLERAKAGEYTSGSLKELPDHLVSRYFHQAKEIKSFGVKAFLKNGIEWQNNNFIDDLPRGKFDCIFIRNNLLTYYDQATKNSILVKVANILNNNGLLIIGSHEQLPLEGLECFSEDRLSYVFRKG